LQVSNGEVSATKLFRWCLNFQSASHILSLMKRGTFSVCLACGLAFGAGLRAADEVLPGDPYAPIVVRNVFGLNPPAPVDTKPDTTPPAKITANGIMTIFGSKQVLFKVADGAKPGQRPVPAKETSYILSEGQRQDDIEVTHIDEKNGIVTFDNHGVVQEIPLTTAPALTVPVATGGRRIPAPVMPTVRPVSENVNRGSENLGRFNGRFGNSRETGSNNRNGFGNASYNNSTYNNSVNESSNLRTVPARPQVDPDQQKAIMAVESQLYSTDPQYKNYPPLPPISPSK
jgi:hypothetical protein